MTDAKKNTGNPMSATLALLREKIRPRLARLMGYYRNPISDLADYLPTRGTTLGTRPYRQYQEIGLPARITGFRNRDGGEVLLAGSVDVHRREVVIENDIGWRLHTLVDFVAGQMPAISSAAKNPETRSRLTGAIRAVFERSGGVGLLQELVLAASIHGAAYLKLEPNGAMLAKFAGDGEEAQEKTPAVRLIALHATRVVPTFAPGAAEVSGAEFCRCAIADENAAPQDNKAPKNSWLGRVGGWVRAAVGAATETPSESAEIWDADRVRRFAGDALTAESANVLGFVPVIGFVNQTDAAGGMVPGLGLSDVEPLIPLQDELNTRLSDRANRVTLQSFRMYLGTGIEDFAKRPVGPGQMWSTDNPDATITAFGGDAAAPSEESHINEIREALDKISGVTPVAAGLLRGKVGNLTSAVALRVTLIALLARTERKRAGLALTLAAACRRALELLDRAGVVHSAPDERDVEITWPSAIPENATEKLTEAQMKIGLGVPRCMVLAELGYDQVEIHQAEKGEAHEQAGIHTNPARDLAAGERGAESRGGVAGEPDAAGAGDGGVLAPSANEVTA